ILKDYTMVGMGNSFGNPKKDLEDISKSFDESLSALKKFNKDSATKKALEDEKKLWAEIKKSILETPSKEKVTTLQHKLDELLKVANNTTGLFAKQSKEKTGDIINISGRQRMLSQRMASLYMLKVWGINSPEFDTKMKDAMKLFKESHQKLKSFDKNTPKINTLLKKVEHSFKFFEIMSKSKSKFIPSLIYKKSNDILKNMNEATNLYTKLEGAK
ncbi:MAG: hypothetical protein DSZ06_03175, partial [Sulfurospirillum sp.]